MSEDKTKRGAADRARIDQNESYEVSRVAQQTDMPPALVRKIAEQVGPSRAKVVDKLNQMKKNGRR